MNSKHQSGFSLPEILIAMSILSIVVFSATNLMVSVVRSNNENVNRFVAYGLAQEGLEAVRNIRDSNWLLQANFRGEIKGKALWGTSLYADSGKSFFVIDQGATDNSSVQAASVNENTISTYTPWKLSPLNNYGSEESIQTSDFVKLWYVPEEGNEHYTHDAFASGALPTAFGRYVMVEPEDYFLDGTASDGTGGSAEKNKKIKVTSVVFWKESNRNLEVRLTTELTDWYDAQ